MIEYRQFNIEYKSNEESRKVEGYGSVFNSESSDLGFFETIMPGAITQDTINRSDVFATMNHDADKVLARSKYGVGSLQLSVDDRGLHYEYDAPNTQLGNDLLEHLKRGDIDSSSFAFSIDKNDAEAQKWEKRDGKYYRTIYKIERLYDVAAVWNPAYPSATCSKRNLSSEYEEDLRSLDNKDDEIPENDENKEVQEDNSTEQDNNKQGDEKVAQKENKEEKNDCNDDKDVESIDNNETDTEKEEKKCVEEKNKINNDKKIMEKRFSLVGAINDIANNRNLDNIASEVTKMGAEEMRATGLSFGGQIQIPMSELRSDVTVAAEGEDVVATDLYDIIGPLRAKNVLVQAGAKFLTNLVGDVQIPIMSATNVSWAGETAAAGDGAPTFTSATLSPKRLTAYVNISKQLLNQHSVDVDNMIRQDILAAINSKLESTILGTAAGSTTQPAGMFNGKTTTKSVTTMAKIAEIEGDVEAANVIGECKWIVSPTFKATLRDKAKGSNVSQSLYANGEIDGTTALSTSNVGANTAVYGDFSNLAIGQWGAIDLTVDPYTQAKNGMIVLVVNAYFDAKVLRDSAFGFATTAAS